MIGISNILPFLENARTIRVFNASVRNEDIFFTKSMYERLEVLGDVSEGYLRTLISKVPTAYLVQPLGMVVLQGTDYDLCILKKNCSNVFCTIHEVDYSSVARAIEVEEKEDYSVARYPHLNGYLEEPLSTSQLIDYSITGDELYKPMFGYYPTMRFTDQDGESVNPVKEANMLIKPVRPLLEWEEDTSSLGFLNEAVSLADFANVSARDAVSATDSKSARLIKLESYFTGGYVTNRTPLLVGPSAVAKSAVIKALAKQHGMRLVDVRLAFTSRLDIEGLTGRKEVNGVIMSESSPASFMLECSDAYIDFCRDSLVTLSQALENETDPDKKKVIEESVIKFREGAKIPVLFLDEVTRAPASVRQAFTKILSDKEFMGYPMTYARVVAATNSALGAPEELQGIYQTQDVGDSAFYDRFESIQVHPEDVYNDWYEWANSDSGSGKKNIHPYVIGVIDQDRSLAYDFNYLYSVYQQTENEDDVTSSPYPNYRTWELVSNYLYSQEKSKSYMDTVISGLVGDKASHALCEVLNKNGWKLQKPSKDALSDVIEQGMNTGVPVMMITPSSIGKCITAGHMVEIDNKFVNIETLEYASDGYLSKEYTVESTLGKTKTSDTYIQKVKRTIIATLQDGRTIEGTPDHPVLCYVDGEIKWVTLSDLKPFMVVMGKKREFVWPVQYETPLNIQSEDVIDLEPPDKIKVLNTMANLINSNCSLNLENGKMVIPFSQKPSGLGLLCRCLRMVGYSPIMDEYNGSTFLVLGVKDARFMIENIKSILQSSEVITEYCQKFALPEEEVANFFVVTSVEGKEQETLVYDLVIPEGRSFVANGVWVHNTARIKSMAKKRDAMLIDINLAEQDRVDLLGPPVRVPVERFVASSISALPEELQKAIGDSVSKYDLPSHVTIKAPKEDIITKLQEASAQGREVIVHFDELNRVQNPSVMSSVFECISDHRVLGVSFDPQNVRVFASCNMGENYSDAQSLDPAFSARFVMYKRASYEKSDVDAFIQYMEQKKFSKSIIDYFKSRSPEEALAIISSVETRTLELSSASTRAWEDLDKFLKDIVNKNVCKGTVCFQDTTEADVYQSFMERPSMARFKAVDKVMNEKLENWAGKNSGISIPITSGGKRDSVSAFELVDLYKQAKTDLEAADASGDSRALQDKFNIMKNVLLYFFSANREITSSRSKIFKMALGPFSDSFTSYYNTVSGLDTEELDISDCVNTEKFHKYVAQETRGVGLPNEIARILIDVTKKFAEEFPSADQVRSRDVINHSVSCLNTSEAVGEYLRGIAFASKNVESLVATAEGGDSNFTIILLKKAGINVSAEVTKNATKVVRVPRVK